jgi:SAM-dependent methyltransferase
VSDTGLAEAIEAARAYEALHVPALYEEWVGPDLDAACVSRGQRVLDVACGTGVLARGASARVGPSGYVAGLDPGPGMLAVASELAPSVEWRAGFAESLPFEADSFDAVISQFGIMFFADRTEAIREMLRVLPEGGHLAVAVWDSLDRTPAYGAEVQLLERTAGQDAADALRAPFVLGDPAVLASIFQVADAASVEVVTRTGTGNFPSVRSMVEADLRGWLPIMGVDLPEELILQILEEAEEVLASFVTAEGRVVFDSPAHIVSATKA